MASKIDSELAKIECLKEICSKNGFLQEPNLWIADLYITQDDNVLKGKYFGLHIETTKYFSKDEITELLKLEWLAYIFPNIRRYLKKSLENSNLSFATKNDDSIPDIKLGNEYYELTFAELEIFKYKDGREFETKILEKQKDEHLDNSKKQLIRYGNPNAKIVINVEKLMQVRYRKILRTIEKKMQKNYKCQQPINLCIFQDRNNVDDISYQITGIEWLVKNHMPTLRKALSKFKNIYIVGEDRINHPDLLKPNNLKDGLIRVFGIKLNLDVLKKIENFKINDFTSLTEKKNDFIYIFKKSEN